MSNRFEQMRGIILDNRYKIDKNIGTGGMADVYLGQDLLLERPVALKILHTTFADDAAFVTRFKREAQAAGKLNNPHIVNMYDVGIDQGYNYIVMEYVPGITLKEYIKEKKRLSTEEAVQIALAIGDGLEHAHSMGIIHCDVKPHNIMITSQGAIKVTDFGIARAINTSQTTLYTTSVMGSAHYLSPEQASGKAVDVASDIYSLGVVLYEMLTGRVPYEGDSAISVALKHVRETAVKPSVYCPNILPSLEGVVMKALQKKPENRFHSIKEMMAELRLSLNYRGGSAPLPKSSYDFATQLLPKVEEEPEVQMVHSTTGSVHESTGNRFLDLVNRVPPKLFGVGAVVIFLFAFLWAYFSFGNFWSNATVVVPDVVGKQVSVAKNILEDRHLKVTINEVAHPEIPAGRVISMNPDAGTEVKENRNIRLVVSKGAGDISLPDLVGLSLEDAKKALNNLGLSVGNIEAIEDSSKPEGVVISQKPSAFEKLAKGTSINLTVNKKAEKSIPMPKLVGLTIKDARTILGDLNLVLGTINGDGEDSSVITDQSPAASILMAKGESVIVAASKAKDTEKDKTITGTVDITVPKGGKAKSVKIVVADDAGRRTVYEANHNPGDNVVRQVSGVGSVRVQVYINGTLVQDQLL